MEGTNKRLSAHFEGKTRFLDDLDNPDNLLYGYIYGSPVDHGKIKSLALEYNLFNQLSIKFRFILINSFLNSSTCSL